MKMLESKLSQGAKPGKVGMFPGERVDAEIAEIRGIKEGQASIAPDRHKEVSNWSELLDMVGHIREVTGRPVGIKMAVGGEEGLHDLFQAVRGRGEEAAPDFLTVDGGEGGTGAAPLPLMDLVGMTIREALPLAAGLRNHYGLKERIRLIASGKLMVPGDVAWALCAGADFVTSARGFMFSLGCIQAMKCNKNTCPTGITTHDPRFQRGLVPEDKEHKVARYAQGIIKEVEIIAHSVGVTEPRLMRRKHVRLGNDQSVSVPMHPTSPVAAEYSAAYLSDIGTLDSTGSPA